MQALVLVAVAAILLWSGKKLFEHRWTWDKAILGIAAGRFGLSRRFSLQHELTDVPKWSGVVDGHRVTMTRIGMIDREVLVEVTHPSSGAPRWFTIGRRTQYENAWAGVATGDGTFDALIHVDGGEDLVRAALGWETRSLILKLMQDGNLSAEQSRITWDAKVKEGADSDFLYHRLRDLLRLARDLEIEPGQIASRLEQHVMKDQVPAVRLASFELLAASDPERKSARTLARMLLESEASDPHLRLAAARYLGDPKSLVVLRSMVMDQRANEGLRASALMAWSSRSSPDETAIVLRKLLEDSTATPALRIDAIRIAGRPGHEDLLPLLVEKVVHAGEAELIVLAEVLGAMGGSAAEDALLKRLALVSPAAQEAVIEALGRIGTAAAVAHLTSFSHGRHPGSVKEAARNAVKLIQSRLLGAEDGQLSLSRPNEGAGTLSVAEDVRGSLSAPAVDRSRPETEVDPQGMSV